MDSEVFGISTTQLEFCERIYTWDGWCWADKNGISRTSYLVHKGIIAAGYRGCGNDKNLAVDMKCRNNGKKSRDINLEGDNQEDVIDTEGDNDGGHEEPTLDNKEDDKIGKDIDDHGVKCSFSEQLCVSSPSEQLYSVLERSPVKRELYDV